MGEGKVRVLERSSAEIITETATERKEELQQALEGANNRI